MLTLSNVSFTMILAINCQVASTFLVQVGPCMHFKYFGFASSWDLLYIITYT